MTFLLFRWSLQIHNLLTRNVTEQMSISIKILRKGDVLTFSGKYHGSVGFFFRVECDECAFKVERGFRHLHPEKMEKNMCGGDEAVVTYELVPLKCGISRIAVISDFRGGNNPESDAYGHCAPLKEA